MRELFSFGVHLAFLCHNARMREDAHYKKMNTLLEFLQIFILVLLIEEWILEANSDCYGKDRMFFASFAFCVITFEPIMIQTCSAPQNDRLNFSFVKDIKVVVEKTARNCRKTAIYHFVSQPSPKKYICILCHNFWTN